MADSQDIFDLLTAGEASFVRWFGKHPTYKRHIGGRARTAEELDKAIAQLNRNGYSGYVHLNPTVDRGAVRTTAEDVTAWEFMLIDMDPIDEWKSTRVTPFAAIEQLAYDVEKWLLPGAREHMTTVLTGRGAQLWLQLTPMVLHNEQERYLVTNASNHFLERVQRFAPHGYKVDLLGDVARIGRLPGTIHQGTKVPAAAPRIGTVGPIALSHAILAHYVSPQTYIQPDDVATEWTQDWRDVMDEITARAKRFIDYGANVGNRHGDAQHTAKSLWEHGVSRESAYEALSIGSGKSQKRLPAEDLLSIIKQVYGRKKA